MVVRFGDSSLPVFTVPTPRMRQTYSYAREGVPFSPHGTLLIALQSYMPAPEFNRWYIDRLLRQGVDNLAISKEEALSEAARAQTEALNKRNGSAGRAEITIATTEFTGQSRQTGKEMTGVLASRIYLSASPNSPGEGSWSVSQLVLSGCTKDDKAEARQTILRAVVERLMSTWREDLEWRAILNAQIAAGTNKLSADSLKAIQQSQAAARAAGQGAQRSGSVASNADATRQSIMSSYWKRVGAKDEQQRKFLNYIGDTTDVHDPSTGQTHKVGSGYSNYYRDPHSGSILGTNSASRPPVQFTPLNEF